MGPLREIAVRIRIRFFATYCRSQGLEVKERSESIRRGNSSAHWGNVVTDVLLLRRGLIVYEKAFTLLYGVGWRGTEELIDKRIDIALPRVLLLGHCGSR